MHFILAVLIAVLHVHQAVCQEPSESQVEFYLESSQLELLEFQTSETWEILETPVFSEEPYLMTEFHESLLDFGPSSVVAEASTGPAEIFPSSVVEWELISSAVEPTSLGPECYDREESCADLGITVCSSYHGWARYYCAKFCDLCDQMVATPPDEVLTTAETNEVSNGVGPTTPEPLTTEEAVTTTEEPCCVDQQGWEFCADIRLESCQEPYRAWASQRCQAYCGMCRPCPIEPCEDAIPQCDRFAPETCTSDSYRKWAITHCRKHCGLCATYGFYYILNNITAPELTAKPPIATTVAPTLPACRDTVTHCAEYRKEDCETYRNFMSDHCPRYCGLCSETGSATEATQAPVVDHTQTPTAPTQSQSVSTEAGSTQGVAPVSTSSSVTEILPDCRDRRPDCTSIGREGCCQGYENWARYNCAEFCGFCGRAPTRVCEDQIDYCSREQSDLCTNSVYQGFVRENCAGFCKLCETDPWEPAECAAYLFKSNLTSDSLPEGELVG